jgi:hypothetical protein
MSEGCATCIISSCVACIVGWGAAIVFAVAAGLLAAFWKRHVTFITADGKAAETETQRADRLTLIQGIHKWIAIRKKKSQDAQA